MTTAVQNLRISESRAAPAALASPATVNNEEFQKTATAKITAQGAQGIPSLCAVRPSCRRPLGVYQMEVSCSMWSRSAAVRCCLKTVWDNCVGFFARLVCTAEPSDRSAVASATTAEATLLSANFALGTPSRTDDSPGIRRSARRSGTWAATSSELAASATRRPFDLICKVLGQQNSGPLRRTAGKTQPQTDEQRGRRACAPTARGSNSKAMKGPVGGAAQDSADCRRNWTTALILRSSGMGTHPTSAGTEQNRHRFAAPRQTGANECSLANGRNNWTRLSPSQELVRRDGCSGVSSKRQLAWHRLGVLPL